VLAVSQSPGGPLDRLEKFLRTRRPGEEQKSCSRRPA